MPRRPRRQLDDGFFHVTARAVGGDALFRDDVDRRDFIEQLTRNTLAFHWVCHAYCLMTTHYHLLLETSRESMSQGMHRLNGLYAQRFNARHNRRGHVFESRFQAYVIDSEAHLAAAVQYVLNNPVRAGLCQSADQWPWSGGSLGGPVPRDRRYEGLALG
jgi:REP element-mobilizing transposase RayT